LQNHLKMSAILSIDTLSQRYSILPSKLLSEATTFDLYVCNSAIRFQQIKAAEAEGDYSHYTEEELLDIRSRV